MQGPWGVIPGGLAPYIQMEAELRIKLKRVEETVEKEFQAGPLFLDIVRAEYQNEKQRTSTIDSKVGITLPIVATYFFLVLQYTDIKKIFQNPVEIESVASVLYSVLPPILYLTTLVFAGFALFFLFRVISMHTYATVNIQYYNTPETIDRSPERFAAGIVDIFVEATMESSETNDLHTKLYKRGWRYALISLAFFVLYIFFNH